MIKLKLTSREMQALSRFLQIAIELAKHEISSGSELSIQKFSESGNMIKEVPWSNGSTNGATLKIIDRRAHIDEFERMQRKLLLGYDKSNPGKKKSIQITVSSGTFFLHYMGKVEYAAKIVPAGMHDGMQYVNAVAIAQSDVILKQLI